MRTETSWKEQQDNLRAARILAGFLNLKEGEERAFQEKYPDFMLRQWGFWKQFQMGLRKVWDSGFRQREVIAILTATADDSEGGMWHQRLGKPPKVITAWTDERGVVRQQEQPLAEVQASLVYKKAVLFLFTENWRAKACCECGNRFIAEHSRTKLCSSTCVWAHLKSRQGSWWIKHKDGINKQRKLEYRKLRGNHHAKGKNLRQR